MRVKKIKLDSDGLKGLKIVYEKTEDKDGRSFYTDVIEEKRYPIHLGLEKKFKELRQAYGDILGLMAGKLGDNEIKYILNNIDITGVSFGHDWFVITGKLTTFCDKKIGISTPKIDETDEFYAYKEVQKIIEEIVVETKEYMSGAKKATDAEFGVKYIQSLIKSKKLKEGQTTLDEFESMSPEEQKIWCTNILETKFGSMVSHTEDLIVDEESATVLELQQKVG
jgi:hypothetical protein